MTKQKKFYIRHILMLLLFGALSVCNLVAQTATDTVRTSIPAGLPEVFEGMVIEDALPQYLEADSLQTLDADSLADLLTRQALEEELKFRYVDTYFENFEPKPAKALWMAALFPGGGQIYNRKYWKLPIVYGGFLGLIYGYNWNQRYYKTYQNAYRDLVTNSPNASYLQFIRARDKVGYVESHRSYLEKAFQSRKNTYRNNRDYCVVGMLGVYLVSLVDAYVDAALYHFDVSPELDACNNPSMVVSYKIEF